MSTETIRGVCESVEIKSGWHKFNINIGKNFPVALSTKKESLIAQAQAVGERQCDWVFTPKESDKINEHTQKPYVNRWLEEVHEVEFEVTSPATHAKHVAVKAAAVAADPTRGSIERQTIVKAALPLYPDGLLKTEQQFFALLSKLEEFCAGSVTVATLDEAIVAAAGVGEIISDDDIPF